MSSATYYAGGTVTYYTAAGQPAFNAVATVGAPVWEKVLPVPNAKVAFRQRFMQTAASYTPLALDTPYPADSTYGVPTSTSYYLVSEENFSNERGGLLMWDRVYCAVPTSWTEPEEYAYTYPAFSGSQPTTTYAVTAVTASGSLYTLSTTITYSVGDSIFINVSLAQNTGIATTRWQASGYWLAQGGSSGTTLVVANLVPYYYPGVAFSSVSGFTGKGGKPGRDAAKAIIIPSNVVNDYALASISGLDTSLPLIDAFMVITANGSETDVVSDTTFPNNTTYVSMVESGTQIVAATSIRRRFLGNIYVRQTRYIPAL